MLQLLLQLLAMRKEASTVCRFYYSLLISDIFTSLDIATQLYNAAINNDLKTLEHLIETATTEDLNQMHPEDDGLFYTPLHAAIVKKFQDVVKCLVSAGADLYFKNPFGNNSLQSAVCVGNPVVVRYIIEKDSSPGHLNLLNSHGDPPLHLAIRRGLQEVFEDLIKAGSKPDTQTSSGYHAAPYACLYDRFTMLSFLIDGGHSEVNACGPNYWTSLHVATDKENIPVLQWLINHGANMSAEIHRHVRLTAWELANTNNKIFALSLFAGFEMELDFQKMLRANPQRRHLLLQNGILIEPGNSGCLDVRIVYVLSRPSYKQNLNPKL